MSNSPKTQKIGALPLVSVILPAKNEAPNLIVLLPKLKNLYPDFDIIVINDGSTDNTKEVCQELGVTVYSHPYSMGNGAAIKTGARMAQGLTFVFMDADGQHDPADIPELLKKLEDGYDMAVGARHTSTHASFARFSANIFYNKIASIMTGRTILDLTSGFRAVRARHFKKFLYLLPNGFSYPTTSTMAFFRSGLPVAYVPIHAGKRQGKSNIKLFRDGLRFFLIIIKIGALFSPMRFFLPISITVFCLGLFYYLFTYLTVGRFTNMSALLFTSSLLVFLIGILSEQISALHYKGADEDARRTIRDE
jgi:glycosyltransferase involved in cell wall biosynthesis